MSATRKPLVNLLIWLLVAACLTLLCIPCYVTEGDSASVMGYICMNTDHDGVTDLLESKNPNFFLNGQVWMPIFLFILGAVTLFMMIVKRNLTVSLSFPIAFSLLGIPTVWTNELTRMGGVTVLPTILMAIILVLSLYNGEWLAGHGESAWKKDPQATARRREIDKAVQKKKIDVLQAHAQSTDVSVRIAAINGLAEVGGSAVFQPLIAQLSCSNPDIRIAAAEALGRMGDSRGRSYLLHYMESDPDSRVRASMRKALSMLPSHAE